MPSFLEVRHFSAKPRPTTGGRSKTSIANYTGAYPSLAGLGVREHNARLGARGGGLCGPPINSCADHFPFIGNERSGSVGQGAHDGRP